MHTPLPPNPREPLVLSALHSVLLYPPASQFSLKRDVGDKMEPGRMWGCIPISIQPPPPWLTSYSSSSLSSFFLYTHHSSHNVLPHRQDPSPQPWRGRSPHRPLHVSCTRSRSWKGTAEGTRADSIVTTNGSSPRTRSRSTLSTRPLANPSSPSLTPPRRTSTLLSRLPERRSKRPGVTMSPHPNELPVSCSHTGCQGLITDIQSCTSLPT